MDKCNMMVVIHTDSHCTTSAPSITRMSSLTDSLLLNFIFSCDCALSLFHERQDNIVLIICQSAQIRVSNVAMACMTFVHAQTNYHVSQCSHWNPKYSYTCPNRLTNYFLWWNVVNHDILCRLCTDDLWANTICSSESTSGIVHS